MPNMTTTILPGVVASGDFGNIFGMPKLPVDPIWAYLTRTDAAFSGVNRGRVVAGEQPITPVDPARLDFSVRATGVQMDQRVSGFQTAYVPKGSFTWLIILYTADSAHHTGSLKWPTPEVIPAAEPIGVGFYTGGTGNFRDVNFRFGEYDGDPASDADRVTITVDSVFRQMSAPTTARGLWVRHDADAGRVTIARGPGSGSGIAVTHYEFDPGKEMDLRSDRPFRLGGTYDAESGGGPAIMNMAVGWDVALTDTQMYDQAFPLIANFLAERGEPVFIG